MSEALRISKGRPDLNIIRRPTPTIEARPEQITHSRNRRGLAVAAAAVGLVALTGALTYADSRGYSISHIIDWIRPAIDHTPNPQPLPPVVPPGN